MKTMKARKYIMIVLTAVIGMIILFLVLGFSSGSRRISYEDAAMNGITAIFSKNDDAVNLLFVGDMMFDRGVASHAEKYGVDSLFKGVKEILRENDAVIGNLEGTITTETPIAKSGGSILRFTFDPSFAAVLKAEGFTAFSLANNHSSDFYGKGFDATKRFLAESGLLYFGAANNGSELSARVFRHGKNICLIGYHDLYTFDAAPAIAEISKIRPECDYVVLFAHWGDEYKQKQSPRQVALAHEFIDTGADLVIGAHPHVVQPVEVYKNKAIFYSLGNFIFDQGLSFWTEHGLAVRVELSIGEDHRTNETKFTLIPTVLNRTEASVAGPEDAQKILKAVGLDSAEFTLEKE